MDDDLQQLQGTLRAVRIECGGVAVPAEAARKLKYGFAGDQVTLVEGATATGAGSVTLEPEPTPGAITVRMTDGPGHGQTASGIYEIAGDSLTLCIGPDRPAEFSGRGPAALIQLAREVP